MIYTHLIRIIAMTSIAFGAPASVLAQDNSKSAEFSKVACFTAIDAVVTQTREVEARQVQTSEMKLGAVVANLEIGADRAGQLVCFSRQWYELDSVLGMLMSALRSSQSQAFEMGVSAPREADCFYPELITPAGEAQVLKVLTRMDRLTQKQLAVLTLRDSNVETQEPLTEQFKAEKKDRTLKAWRAEKVVGGAEVLGMAMLLMAPSRITKWEVNPLQLWKFKRAWTRAPVWDRDEWYINYIGHPVAGALYYSTLRSHGASKLESFAFSTAQSVAWEYLIESWAEQPSIQDLLFTSTIGSVYGEAAHLATLRMRKNGFRTWEKVVVTIINPMYVVMNGYK